MTTALDIEKAVCRQCFAVLDSTDRFCRHCGASTGGSAADSPAVVPAWVVPEMPPERSKLTDNPWVVLAVLFLVLGPLGLPMLWRCRAMPTAWKVVLTIVMVGVVALIVALIWYVTNQALAPLRQLDALRGL